MLGEKNSSTMVALGKHNFNRIVFRTVVNFDFWIQQNWVLDYKKFEMAIEKTHSKMLLFWESNYRRITVQFDLFYQLLGLCIPQNKILTIFTVCYHHISLCVESHLFVYSRREVANLGNVVDLNFFMNRVCLFRGTVFWNKWQPIVFAHYFYLKQASISSGYQNHCIWFICVFLEFFGAIPCKTAVNINALRGNWDPRNFLGCLLRHQNIFHIDFTDLPKFSIPKSHIIILSCTNHSRLVFE